MSGGVEHDAKETTPLSAGHDVETAPGVETTPAGVETAPGGVETESEESDIDDVDQCVQPSARRQVQFAVSEEDEAARKEEKEAKINELFVKPTFDTDFGYLVFPNAHPKLRHPELNLERLGDTDLCDLDVQLDHRRRARRLCRRLKKFDRADWERMNSVYQVVNERVEKNIRNDDNVSTFMRKQLEVEAIANEKFGEFGASHPAFRALSNGLRQARNLMKFDDEEADDFQRHIKACERIDKVFRKSVVRKAADCMNEQSRTGRETALDSYMRQLQKDIGVLKNGYRPKSDIHLPARKYNSLVQHTIDDDIELADITRKVVSGETKRLGHSKDMMLKFLKRKQESLQAELEAVSTAINEVEEIDPGAIVKGFTDEIQEVGDSCSAASSASPLSSRYGMIRQYLTPPQVLKSGTVRYQMESTFPCMPSMRKTVPPTQSMYAVVSSSGYFHTFDDQNDYHAQNSFAVKMLTTIDQGEQTSSDGKREYFRFKFTPSSLRQKGGTFVFFVKSDDNASDWVKAMQRLIPDSKH